MSIRLWRNLLVAMLPACLVITPATADDQGVSFRYLEAAVVDRTPGGQTRNFAGEAVRGVFGFDNGLFLNAGAVQAEDKRDRELSERTAGLGFQERTGDNAWLITRFDLRQREVDGDTDRGVAFNVGGRYRLHHRLEAATLVSWQRLGGSGEYLARGEALGHIAGPVWLRLAVQHGEDLRGWEAGLRLTW